MQHVFAPPTLGMWALFALLATLMGPFGTYATLEWLPRLVYWTLICGLAVVTDYAVRDLVGRCQTTPRSIRFEALSVLGMTLFFSPMVYFVSRSVGGKIFLFSDYFWRIALFVFLSSTMISALRRIQRMQHKLIDVEAAAIADPPAPNQNPTSLPQAPVAATVPECRLMKRLPEKTQGPVLHLSAQDHFVMVELATETIQLRMRFSDAVREMDGIKGYITHRSHWVAEVAIDGSRTKNGKFYLMLTSGTLVPVSRTFRPQLEQEGVI